MPLRPVLFAPQLIHGPLLEANIVVVVTMLVSMIRRGVSVSATVLYQTGGSRNPRDIRAGLEAVVVDGDDLVVIVGGLEALDAARACHFHYGRCRVGMADGQRRKKTASIVGMEDKMKCRLGSQSKMETSRRREAERRLAAGPTILQRLQQDNGPRAAPETGLAVP